MRGQPPGHLPDDRIGKLLAWNQYTALPSILRHADLPELYTALSPAPLQIQYGNADARLDHDDAAQAGERIATSYEPDRAEVLDLPMGHSTGLAEAADFFTRTLAKPAAGDDEPFVPAARVSFGVRARLDVLDLVDDALASGLADARPARRAAGGPGPATSSAVAPPPSAPASSALEIALRDRRGRGALPCWVPANTFFATAVERRPRRGAWSDFVDMGARTVSALDLRWPRGVRWTPMRTWPRWCPCTSAGVLPDSLLQVLAVCASGASRFVEDAAHALGSFAGTGGRRARSADAAAFSLYPTKVITSGEGGLLTAADPADLDGCGAWRDHGKLSFEENRTRTSAATGG